jgi:hypothetical protein
MSFDAAVREINDEKRFWIFCCEKNKRVLRVSTMHEKKNDDGVTSESKSMALA